MKISTALPFFLLSAVAAAADTTVVPAGGAAATLTEAGWCKRCEGKWNDEPSGCKDKKKEKQDHCDSSSNDNRRGDTGTPTSAPIITTSTPTSAPITTTSTPTGAPTYQPTGKSGKSKTNKSRNDADIAKVTLTEAGWCERCKGKWNDEPSGCKRMKKEKQDHCDYSSDDRRKRSTSTRRSTSTPTSAPITTTSTPTGAPTYQPTGKSGKSKTNKSRNDADIAKVTLTEAGWCERCDGKWNDEPSGCKRMKKEKQEHCDYSSRDRRKRSTSTPTSAPIATTSTPTSAPTTSKSGKSSNNRSDVWGKASAHVNFEMPQMFNGEVSPRALRDVN